MLTKHYKYSNMAILINTIIGFTGGILFAFVNYCLVTPFLRDNLMAVLFWGIQGSIFSISYMLFSVFVPTNKTINLFQSIFKGGICGLFSTLLNIIISWQGFVQTTSEEGIFVMPQVSRTLTLDLSYYAAGCFILGAVVVSLIENSNKNRNYPARKNAVS